MENKTLKQIYKDAIKNGYAIGAFNFVNLDMFKSILLGAKNQNSPVIVQTSTSAIDFLGEEYLKMLIEATKQQSYPVFFHLDHGKTFEDCKKCVDIGYHSVMIDASSKPFEENVSLTKSVCDYAHSKGVFVEAELGQLKGVEDDVFSDSHIFTDPLQAKEFVERTGCDSLAVAIGTSHGAYKFAGEPNLRLDILEQIEQKLKDFPLVLHGASSINKNDVDKLNEFGGQMSGAKGIPEELLRLACKEHNIVKINMDSDLRIAYTAEIRKQLQQNPQNFDLRKYIGPSMEHITQVVEHKIKDVLNSKNKA